MARSRALTVAVVAIVLLVVSITVDATMNRSYAVDVKDNGDWRTLVDTKPAGLTRGEPVGPAPYGVVTAQPNGSVELRLRVDNGYPWATTQHYRVNVNGAIAAEGDISAAARGVGESHFNLSAAKLFAQGGAVKPGPDASGSTTPRSAYVYFSVSVGGKDLGVSFTLQEAQG